MISRFSKFSHDRRGVIAIIVAIAALPIILVAGAPIDLARQIELQTTLQNNTDAAALAGASLLGDSTANADATNMAQNYMTASDAPLSATIPKPIVTLGNTVSNITVSAAGVIPATFMAFIKSSLPVSTVAVAGGPGEPTACVTPVATGAADLNSLYVFGVNGLTNATDSRVAKAELADNNNTTYKAGTKYCQAVALALGDRLAFELDNKTAGRNTTYYVNNKNEYGYQANIYGATANTINVFFSSDYPSSLHTDSNSTSSCGSSGPNYTAACQYKLVNESEKKFGSNTSIKYTSLYDNAAVLTVTKLNGSSTTVTPPTACYVANGVPVNYTYNASNYTIALTQPSQLAQQENVIVYNNTTNSVGCGNNIAGSPFNLDATCQELNGATLTVDWNDTGGNFDSVVYGTANPAGLGSAVYTDMSYTYSYTGAAGNITTPFSRVILTQ